MRADDRQAMPVAQVYVDALAQGIGITNAIFFTQQFNQPSTLYTTLPQKHSHNVFHGKPELHLDGMLPPQLEPSLPAASCSAHA
jgi:hypothetical protein